MTKTLGFLLSASLAACAGTAEVRYSGNASTPELVEMDSDPSVMVVANSDEPVFFSENTYWLYRDQQWYRSRSSHSGWSRVDAPPEHVRKIERPTAYVHYRHAASAPRTTYNERAQPVPRRPVERQVRVPAEPATEAPPASPADRDRLAPEPMAPAPARRIERPEPTAPAPATPLRAETPPAQQVPPPSVEPRDRTDHEIAPAPDRAPVRPDQRPAADRDDRRMNPRDDRDPLRPN